MRRANLPIQSLLLALLLAIPAGRSRAANEGELPDVPRLPPAAAPQVGFEGSALVGQPSDVARALAAPLKAALDVKAAPAASAQSGEELQRALQRPLAPVDGRLPYASVRAGLGLVSLLSGAVYSQPPAGPRLLHRLIEGLPSVQTVVSDYDDTLAFTHAPLSEEAVDAILGVLRAGKSFVIASNRQARVEPGDKLPAVLESLKPLRERLSELTDEQVRRLVVVTDGGGEIDRFDRSGEPRSVYEELAFTPQQKEAIERAGGVVVSRLKRLGAELNAPPRLADYNYSLVFKVGTPPDVVQKAAAMEQRLLEQQGLRFEVEARMAKDPRNPPYTTLRKNNKGLAVQMALGMLAAEGAVARGRRVLVLGDSFYKPRAAARLRWAFPILDRWARRLSGQPLPPIGNESDRKMALGVPRARVVSVALTADPRSNALVAGLSGVENADLQRVPQSGDWARFAETVKVSRYGPATALRLLRAVGSESARKTGGFWGRLARVLLTLALLLGAAVVLALLLGAASHWFGLGGAGASLPPFNQWPFWL